MKRALVVEIGGLNVALPMTAQNEVVPRTAATPLPLGAPLLLGLSAVHGRAVPVVNLAYLLGVTQTKGQLSVLSEVHGERLALPIDQALGLMDVPDAPETAELLSAPVPVGDLGPDGPLMVSALNHRALLERLRTHLERL